MDIWVNGEYTVIKEGTWYEISDGYNVVECGSNTTETAKEIYNNFIDKQIYK